MNQGFNPLDRGNLNQIDKLRKFDNSLQTVFQSPRSGKFESNYGSKFINVVSGIDTFQSPRPGKFESNTETL